MRRMVRSITISAVLAVALAGAVPVAAAEGGGAPDLLLILDASGSMWGQIEGENKIVIARRVLRQVIAELDADTEVGLVAYGHRREGDCEDVETVVAPGPLDRAALVERIDGIAPKGKTPITTAVTRTVELARERGRPATVVLVSDGLETCGGDPCRAVREARSDGVDLLLHVVAFDLAGEDVAELECAAQAGGGLYLDAGDAGELAAALEQAVQITPEDPGARLVVEAVADGALTDATVTVRDAATGEDVASGRTYSAPETNPRAVPVAAGRYDVEVRPVSIEGAVRRFEGVEVGDGETVEKVADFSSGELAIGVERNGALSDATVRVYAAGTGDEIDAGRTYVSARTNPKVFRLVAGTYDVEIGSVEIAGNPGRRFEGVVVEGGGRTERRHEFSSGTLRLGVVAGSERVDAVVNVIDTASGKEADRSRTYTGAKTNPSTFVLVPGDYRVEVRAVRLEGRPQRTLEVTVGEGGEVERTVDFGGSS